MNKLSKRVSVIGLVAVVLVFGVWYFTLWTPRLDEVTKAQKAANAAQMQEGLTTDSSISLAFAKADLPQREKDLALLRNAVPTTNDLPSVFATLSDIAARSGVQLGSVAPVAPSAKRKSIGTDLQPTAMPAGTPESSQPTQAVEILLSFDFKGTYEQTMTFLALVQNVSQEGAPGKGRLLVIDDLSINAESGAVLQVAVTGRAFTSEPPVSGT